MRARWILIAVVLLLILVGPARLPVRAQGNRKVIKITMVSWKFTPDLFTVTQGDTVVLQLSNEDPDKRNHSFAARWLVGKQVTVRGLWPERGSTTSGGSSPWLPARRWKSNLWRQSQGRFRLSAVSSITGRAARSAQ